ncbi:MAG TPA: response regulator transcription factor [Chloroflexota bacterium]|nr:response regulator transcription factor [Chloroflexota bacterium]
MAEEAAAVAEQMQVLVVDDDPAIRQLVTMALEDEGYGAVTARDGQDALELLARMAEAPDVIILDMNMPRVDGWEFARRYRESALPKAPIVVLTAAQDVAQRCADVRADGCIGKPFDLDDLLAAVTAPKHQHAA